MNETPQVILVDDRECPVCTACCKALAIRQLDQKTQILNAREDHPVMREFKRRGLDLSAAVASKFPDRRGLRMASS